MNVPLEKNKTVIAGYERVLNSRLKDAVFFYEEDLKTPLAQRVESLARITFQEKLGSLLDKTRRVQALAEILGEKMNLGIADVNTAKEAAWLMKADLTTRMVFEYTEIQGTVGAYYALLDDVKFPVAQAIEEHYMPRFADDALPETVPGALLAIADKMDTIVGYFAVGMKPSGSADPYQLRRQALGVVRILDRFKFKLNFKELVEIVYENYQKYLPNLIKDVDHKTNTIVSDLSFLRERRDNYLKSEGFSYDIIYAVENVSQYRSVEEFRRIVETLTEFRDKEDFSNLLEVFTRISNILQGVDTREFVTDPRLYVHQEEYDLYEKLQDVDRYRQITFIRDYDYKAYIAKLFELTPVINSYFNKVLVNDVNPLIRQSRLMLLWYVRDLYLDVADFKQIVKKS
jgi:glycyl-tRNA synthetase beta chain